MGYYINPLIGYYEGDRIDLNDKPVPKRADPSHKWINGGWQEDPAVVAEKLKQQALDLLSETDLVAARCFKAGISYPDEWKAYTADLRLVVNGELTVIPTKPVFPDEAEPYEPLKV